MKTLRLAALAMSIAGHGAFSSRFRCPDSVGLTVHLKERPAGISAILSPSERRLLEWQKSSKPRRIHGRCPRSALTPI